jgi:hypothetical protein
MNEPMGRATERELLELLRTANTDPNQALAGLRLAMSAMTYWRERCEVTSDDVEREGVTVEQRTAWLRSKGAETIRWRDATSWMVNGHQVARIPHGDRYASQVTARVAREAAMAFAMSPWMVLHEMAEMEP